ncbi:MAG: stage III sporulation protein AC [Clostridiales bacterium]|nr:stage III sporulation protein AC [Clostridiales bacterium]
MSIDMVFQIAAIGILVSVLSQVLTRAGRDDIAMLTTLTGLVVVLIMVVNMISEFFGSVKAIFQLY